MARKKYTTEESLKAAEKIWYKNAHERFKAKYAAGDTETVAAHKKRQERWRGNNKEQVQRIERSSVWRNKFGIVFQNDEELNRYLDAAVDPNTKCIITGMTNAESLATFGKRLALDHCHKTHRPRGFVCDYVNHALGHLEKMTPEQQEIFFSLVRAYRR